MVKSRLSDMKALLPAIVAVLVTGCGGAFFIPSTTSYRMGASVDDLVLGDGSTVRSDDVLVPFFSSAVAEDPDVDALTVTLETEAESAAAAPVEYKLSTGSRAAGTASVADDGTATFYVSALSGGLPSFSLPPDLPLGSYILAFTATGGGSELARSSAQIYWLGDADFSLDSVVAYPPGTVPSSSAPVLPVGVPVLVEASVTVDPGIDAWITWYSGSKRIGGGRVSEGAYRMLWTPPSSEGFHPVRAELTPVEPPETRDPSVRYLSASTTVAVSADAPMPGLTLPDSSYSTVYRFLGNLADTSGTAELQSDQGEVPGFAPLLDDYGLAVGLEHSYSASRGVLPVDANGIVPFRIITRAALPSDGTVWTIRQDGADGVVDAMALDLTVEDGALVLLVESGGAELRLDAELPEKPRLAAYTIEIQFSPGGSGVEAKLLVDDMAVTTALLPSLPGLSDDGSLRFGGVGLAAANGADGSGLETTAGGGGTEGMNSDSTDGSFSLLATLASGYAVIVDDFAILRVFEKGAQ